MELGAKPKVSRQLKPDFKPGEYCRILEGDSNIEAIINAEVPGEDSFEVTTVGFAEDKVVAAKDLLPSLGKTARESQEAKAAASKTWAVGDFCRALWSQDSVIYEGAISSLDTHDGKQYAIVQFLGYGNEDSVWMHELMVSRGPRARARQEKEAAGGVEASSPESPKSKEWKLNARCRAVSKFDGQEYEATLAKIDVGGLTGTVHFVGVGVDETIALSELKSSAGKEARAQQREKYSKSDANALQNGPAEKMDWKVGDLCRAVFSEDGLEYEGTVLDVQATEDGNSYALVRYLGYENEETVWLQDLMVSAGKDARDAQAVASGKALPQDDVQQDSVKPPEAAADQVAEKTEEQAERAEKKWSVGDKCRATFAEDGVEYEGDIIEMGTTEDGNEYAIVRYLGYGNEESQWLADLKVSNGCEAREAQIAASEPAPVPDAEPSSIVDPEEKPSVTNVVESKLTENVAEIPRTWSINDRCMAVCKFDGREHEIVIVELHPLKPLVRGKVVGYDEKEIFSIDRLKPLMIAATKAPVDCNGDAAELPVLVPKAVANPQGQEAVAPAPAKINCQPEVAITSRCDAIMEAECSESNIAKFIDAKIDDNNNATSVDITITNRAAVDATSGSDITIDINKDISVSNGSEQLIGVATKLAKELEGIKVIAELRKRLELKELEIRQLEDRNSINEIIIQEMRETNVQLRASNDRYKLNEAKFFSHQTETLNDIKTLLGKIFQVDQLREEKKALVGELIKTKAANL